MEIEYQITKTDYKNFYKSFFKNEFRKKSIIIFTFPLLIALSSSSEPRNVLSFIYILLAGIILFISFYCLIPYFVIIRKLNKSILKEEELYLGKKVITATETGLLSQNRNLPNSKIIELNWKSISSFNLNEKFVFIARADNKIILIPKQYFVSENEISEFLGIVQVGIGRARGIRNKEFTRSIQELPKRKPPYLLGLLCLIPLLGIIAGIVFIILAFAKFKDKWFGIMGAFGIAISILAYSLVSYMGDQTVKLMKLGYADISQMQLNSLVKNIEFYKLQNGFYPDSLQQLLKEDKLAPILDATQLNQKQTSYNYKKVGNRYLLFSSGQDGIPNTKDDLYPQILAGDSSKIGLIKPR